MDSKGKRVERGFQLVLKRTDLVFLREIRVFFHGLLICWFPEHVPEPLIDISASVYARLFYFIISQYVVVYVNIALKKLNKKFVSLDNVI